MTTIDVPATPTLEGFLRGLDLGGAEASMRLEGREVLLAGTHPKEIVTCRFLDGRRVTLLCKYGGSWKRHHAHGHRRGVQLENAVYGGALEPLGIPAPHRFRPRQGIPDDRSWLVLEYLDESLPLSSCEDGAPYEEAARIAGRLHTRTSESVPAALLSLLKTYDRDYYRGWARRTVRFLEPWSGGDQDFGWIAVFEDRCDTWIDPLLGSPLAVIHGEFYPKNLLQWNGAVYPIDWESAAVGAGEIDLAALTEGWGPEKSRTWETAYQQSRWSEGPPDDHHEALTAARIYLQLRWLGDRPEWTAHESSRERVSRLRVLAEDLGLL